MNFIDSIEILLLITVAIVVVKHFSDDKTSERDDSIVNHSEVDYIDPEENVSDDFIRLATSDEIQEPVNKPKFANTYIVAILFLIILAFIPAEEAKVLFIFGLGLFIGKTVL